MTTEQKPDYWSSKDYQNSAGFVPKLASKVVEWLDPQKDDVILDIGCGDGVLDRQLAEVLAQGSGSLHGIDSSRAMIDAAKEAGDAAGVGCCTFQVMDATELANTPALQRGQFSKLFSNAAMHWILGPPDSRERFFRGCREALAPGGVFAFEMGGLGNVSEMRAGLLAAVGRRLGLLRARQLDPWFFPDETWARHMLEEVVGGWRVERIEREWRPTTADAGGVDGWVRLMGRVFFEAVPEQQREECIREAVAVLEAVCAKPDGGYMMSYVRLRVLARKL